MTVTEEHALQILNKYPSDQYNVLAPATVTQVSPWHRIIVSEVNVDPDPSHGDVYRHYNGTLAMHKETLLRLADAAGIRFPNPPQFSRDSHDGSYDCTIRAEKQDPDGTWRAFYGSYRWDVTERLQSISNPDSRAGQAEIRMIRTFSMQRAETGAISRAIRKIIQIRQTYSPADLQKPFIVARISFDPWNDPAIREAYRQALSVRLAENVAIMRGDFSSDDPLSIDAPHTSSRPTHRQLAAANDVLGLMNGETTDTEPLSESEWGEETFAAGEDEPEQASGETGITSPSELLEAVNDATSGYYNAIPHMLHAIEKTTGDKYRWPNQGDTKAYNVAYAMLIDYAEAQNAG